MGLLSLGTPMPWSEAKKHADHVRKHGIIQFLNIWNRIKTRRRDHLLWGDEVEYMVVKFDHETKTAKLSLDAFEALQKLEGMELDAKNNNQQFPSSWKPEYGRYMLEGTPGAPYGSTLKDLLLVEDNMVSRRLLAKEQMAGYEGQDILTLTNFPRLGCEDCWFGESIDGECKKPNLIDGKSKSLFIPDVAINPHARFRTLTGNIRERRGAKVFINIPIYNDINTPKPFLEPLPPSLSSAPADLVQSIREESNSLDKPIAPLSEIKSKTLPSVIPDALPDSIYLDAMCFGMGCSCLQVTFQACCVEEARTLYDQLAVVSPIMLALTAAAPIFRGFLSNIDARWDVIAASVDDRTKQETGIRPLTTDKFRIHKSRYDSISHYLSSGPSYSGGCSGPRVGRRGENDGYADFYRSVYDDLDAGYDEQIYRKLLEEGLDTSLAKHYAHLFIRDPLVIFEELLDQDDKISSDHFENIQSTNWQTMRFKPPPATAENIGWRVEFRSMEIQLTDFENAAFSIFVVLLTRTILSFDLNFYICLSKVDENMGRAKKMDAALKEKFWFRKNVFGKLPEPSSDSDDDEDQPKESGGCGCDDSLDVEDDIRRGKGRKSLDGVSNSSKDHLRSSFIGDEDEAVELTINEIINGKDGEFPGLATLISSYLQSMPLDHRVSSGLEKYLSFIRKKASGEIPTTASWIRNFVGGHPAYKKDSVVSDEVNYDLLMKIKTMGDENKGPGL